MSGAREHSQGITFLAFLFFASPRFQPQSVRAGRITVESGTLRLAVVTVENSHYTQDLFSERNRGVGVEKVSPESILYVFSGAGWCAFFCGEFNYAVAHRMDRWP